MVITAIALGLWAGVFIMGFYFGIIEQKINDVVRSEVSHIQIHHPDYKKEDFNINYFIPDGLTISEDLSVDTLVQYTSGRVISMGMIGSAKANSGVRIIGIDPEVEALLTGIDNKVIEGAFFKGVKRNAILVGQKLATKLNIKVRSKVVLTFQHINGEITAAAFRVAGIFKTLNTTYDESNVYVNNKEFRKLVGENITYHEIAILLKEHEYVDTAAEKYKGLYPGLLVEDWLEIVPLMRYMTDMMDQVMLIFMLIIMLALMFGIVNTMLMAVLERTRELGMLMAIGMNKFRLFNMILLETLILAMVGGLIGLILGYITIEYYAVKGIDVGIFSAAYESVGFSTKVFPQLEARYYIQTALQVVILSIFASLYPGRKALKLKPVEAIRKI